MPNQIEGTLSNGEHFYYRARHGCYRLDVGVEPGSVNGHTSLCGQYQHAGWWSVDEALEHFYETMGQYLASKAIGSREWDIL